jgi:hypothetical protein
LLDDLGIVHFYRRLERLVHLIDKLIN